MYFMTFFQGYGPLIRVYVQFILAKLRFHRLRPEFNGLFEYEEYISLKGIDDPNEGYAFLYFSSEVTRSNVYYIATRLFPISWVCKIRSNLFKG